MSIGRLWGIEIRLDWSLGVIFLLVLYSLGAGVYPAWHEDWDPLRVWATACAAALLFFASLLAHELAHSLVAQRRGLPVRRITLFVFGGVSEIEREPDTPASELLIAIVGPATSIFLGVVFTRLGLALAPESFATTFVSDPKSAMASLGSAATLLLWIGPLNVVLGIFNLIPGFPLDGGRVFHAGVWWATGNVERATQWAANAGRGFAWALMALGVLRWAQGGLLQGVWLILIGWFLQNAAAGSRMRATLRRAVAGLRVRDLMRTRFDVAEPHLPLEVFLEEYLLRSGQSQWPVMDNGRLVGMVSFDDVRKGLASEGRLHTVLDAMEPLSEPLSPDTSGRDALQILLRSEVDPHPVVENGHLVGLLYRADIMRWLAVHQLEAGGTKVDV